jgi:hypothetical protein
MHSAAAGAIGIDPPWQPTPRNDPPRPDVPPILPDRRPLVPPDLVRPDRLVPSLFSWGTAGTVTTTAVLTFLLTWGLPRLLQAIRQWRIANNQRTLLNDSQFERLLAALRAAGSPPAADKPSPPAGRVSEPLPVPAPD